MAERNYLKTEAVFLTEKTPKKEVVVTPPLREDSLTVTENGTYQAPIGRGYTDVSVNVKPTFDVNLTYDEANDYYTADKTNGEILEAINNGFSVMLYYTLPMSGYEGFVFTSPLLASAYNEQLSATIFDSNAYVNESNSMLVLYSDLSTPIGTNNVWWLSRDGLVTDNDLWNILFDIDIIQDSPLSDNFNCTSDASNIISSLTGELHIPRAVIQYANSAYNTQTSYSIQYDNNDVRIIYYDPEKNAMCQLVHTSSLPYGNSFVRSTI